MFETSWMWFSFEKLPQVCKFSFLQDWDWFNGRNFCRDRCMDLVSFDTPGEFKMFEEIMARGEATSDFYQLWLYNGSCSVWHAL